MVTIKRQGNVAVAFVNIATGIPYDILSFEDSGPPDAFPQTMTVSEANAKYGISGIKWIDPPAVERKFVPGVEATEDDVKKFFNENKVETSSSQTPIPVKQEYAEKLKVLPEPSQTPGFIDTQFIDDMIMKTIDAELEQIEYTSRYASKKALRDLTLVREYLRDWKIRIQKGLLNGKN